MNSWSILGIEPTNDINVIKAAFSEKSKLCHPEDDPEGFQRLYKAYKELTRFIKRASPSPASSKALPESSQNKSDAAYTWLSDESLNFLGSSAKKQAPPALSFDLLDRTNMKSDKPKGNEKNINSFFEDLTINPSVDETQTPPEKQKEPKVLSDMSNKPPVASNNIDTIPQKINPFEKFEKKLLTSSEKDNKPRINFEKIIYDEECLQAKTAEKYKKAAEAFEDFEDLLLNHNTDNYAWHVYINSPDFNSLKMDPEFTKEVLFIFHKYILNPDLKKSIPPILWIAVIQPFLREWRNTINEDELTPLFNRLLDAEIENDEPFLRNALHISLNSSKSKKFSELTLIGKIIRSILILLLLLMSLIVLGDILHS